MSRGHGRQELSILAVVEAWSPFVLTKLLPKGSSKDQAKSLKRAARGLADKGLIEIGHDEQGRVTIARPDPARKRLCWGEMDADGTIVPYPNSPPLPKRGKLLTYKDRNGAFVTIRVGRTIHSNLTLRQALLVTGCPTRAQIPEWGEREAELDRQHSLGRTTDSTRGWQGNNPEPDWEDALMQKAERIVAERKDHLDTRKRLARMEALEDAIEDDRRRGGKWRKGLRQRGDEDSLDDEGRDFLPNERGRARAVDAAAISAAEGQDDANRLMAEPAGTLEQSEEDRERQGLEDQEQTAQEAHEATSESDWKDEERERLASLTRPVDDDFEPPDNDE